MTKYNVSYKTSSNGDDYDMKAVVEIQLPDVNTSDLPPKTDLKKITQEYDAEVLRRIETAIIENLPANYELVNVGNFYE